MRWRVLLFQTASGRIPVADYIERAPSRDKARIVHTIDLLEEAGLDLLGTAYMKGLTREILELRIKGEQLHRVLLFRSGPSEFVLLHAYAKQSNRTPKKELDVADSRMRDWVARRESPRRERRQ